MTLSKGKRRFPRANLNGTAQLTQGKFRCTGEIATISEGGAFVSGIPALPLAAEYRVHLILPRTFEPVVCRAEILYNLPPSDTKNGGVGLRFTMISADSQARIGRLVLELGEAYETLLHALTVSEPDRAVVDSLCYELGLPLEQPFSRLRWLVLQGVNQFRL